MEIVQNQIYDSRELIFHEWETMPVFVLVSYYYTFLLKFICLLNISDLLL